MPIHDITCAECGYTGEVLMTSASDKLLCPECGSDKAAKLMSATSSLTGKTGQDLPGPGDHTCCGGAPGAGGCAGPGSCCGKA